VTKTTRANSALAELLDSPCLAYNRAHGGWPTDLRALLLFCSTVRCGGYGLGLGTYGVARVGVDI